MQMLLWQQVRRGKAAIETCHKNPRMHNSNECCIVFNWARIYARVSILFWNTRIFSSHSLFLTGTGIWISFILFPNVDWINQLLSHFLYSSPIHTKSSGNGWFFELVVLPLLSCPQFFATAIFIFLSFFRYIALWFITKDAFWKNHSHSSAFF